MRSLMMSPVTAVALMSRPLMMPPRLLRIESVASISRRLPACIRPLLSMLPATMLRLLVARRVPLLCRSPPVTRLTSWPWISAPLGARRLLAWAR
ncbi:hypothetical protein PFLmoz3_06360 [Pseudomonas fluorescens]|uniref:Uncharacterized protein n=1 Tax=Pseudomonas fluorescens TaxID=294 RepID=A0A109KER5_PSEFL|nr:hypothetical protein PFLmoz3_06360 [Pseudomonas fluorescens]